MDHSVCYNSGTLGQHLSGRIESFDLIDLIQWLEVRRVSGRLSLTRGADRKTIDWKEGDIVYVSGGRDADRLGYSLLRSRAVPVSGLYSALAENLAAGKKLTYILLEKDLIARDRLASIVEALAKRLLREVLTWRRGRFDFDPDFATEDVFQIHLKIKGQVIAFEAVKEIDDTARTARAAVEEEEGETWEQKFRPESLEEAFWEIRSGLEDESDVAKEKDRFFRFRGFANALHARLAGPVTFLPIYEDSARYAADLLQGAEGPEAEEKLLGLVRLDPFLKLNLLLLSNSLAVTGIRRVATAPEAVRRIGSAAFRAFIECLTSPGSARLSTADPVARLLRRASLAAALSAGPAASDDAVPPDEVHAAALLHAVPYADLLGAVESAPLPAGSFRAAALEYFRPAVAAIRSDAWRLPASLAAVLADTGEAQATPLVAAVRRARSAIPGCAIGPLPPAARKAAAGRRGAGSEVERVFALLNLGAP